MAYVRTVKTSSGATALRYRLIAVISRVEGSWCKPLFGAPEQALLSGEFIRGWQGGSLPTFSHKMCPPAPV